MNSGEAESEKNSFVYAAVETPEENPFHEIDESEQEIFTYAEIFTIQDLKKKTIKRP